MIEAYEKVRKVIESCDEKRHIRSAKRMIFLFFSMYHNFYYRDLLQDVLNHKMDEFVWF